MKTNPNTSIAGILLVEMIVYIAILTLVVSALALTAGSLVQVFARLRATEDIAETAVVAMERITRELRFAESVDSGASTLGSNPGELVLNSFDDAGDPTVVTFALSGGRLMHTQGTLAPSPLSHAGVTITDLVFTYILGTETEAVRVEMTLEKTVRGVTLTKDFRTFVVLDAS